MTLDEIICRVERSRPLPTDIDVACHEVHLKMAIVAEYQQYLDRYKFSEHFWIWVLGGVSRKGEEYPTGVVVRDPSEVETERRINEFAQEILPQVEFQQKLHEGARLVIPSPIRWASFFVGKNQSMMGLLRKEARGLWACRWLYRRFKDYAQRLESESAEMQLSGQLPLEGEVTAKWPADPRECFPWKPLPVWRPWLLDVSPARRNLFAHNPGVRALETRAIGYMGKVVSTAALNLITEDSE